MLPRVFRIILFSAAVILLAQTSVWCQQEQSANDEKAATVNGTVITAAELNRAMEKVKQQLVSMGKSFNDDQISELRSDVLDNLIGGELLYQESQKNGIKVDQQAVDEQLAILKKRFPSEEEFNKAIATLNLSETDIKKEFGKRIAVQEYIQTNFINKTTITPDEVTDFYENNKSLFNKSEQVRASHILIKVPPTASEEEKKIAYDKIKSIEEKAKNGEDFATLAKESSDCPSAAKGGDLGYFSRGQMVKEFEQTAFTLKPEEISDIVETRFGYHLIKVLEKQPQTLVPLEEAQPTLEQYLKQKKVQEQLVQFVEQLKKEAEVKRYL